jgi:very-short-patch-repair endonuclease
MTPSSPTKGMLRDRARGMRKQPSQAERAIWEIVRDGRLGFKFRRQRPISRYVADFACLEARLRIKSNTTPSACEFWLRSAGVFCVFATRSCFQT